MWEPTVESVMTAQVVTARPDTPFKALVASMSESRVSGVPVMAATGELLGVVSEADTLAKQEHLGGTAARPWFAGRKRRARWRKASGTTAADLMTAPAITIGPTESVSAAARLLAAKKVRRLCVVDEQGRLVGIVSRRDVIATFLRADHDISTDVRELVFKKGMWLFPGSLDVEIIDGVATLTGSVERRTTAQVAAQLTQAVPGVVGVRNKIDYELDDTVANAI
jgi:CBS domain-containing protein